MTAVLCALFFLSGVAALLFETLWFRQAGLAFGNSVWASSLVLSSFMAGMALGNFLAARLGGRMRSPLRVYAVLELVIALAGLALVFRLQALTPLLVPLLSPLADWPWLQNPVRLGLGFVLLLLPATAMGATLPVIVAGLRARDASFGGALGLLYGWNTLGAVVGATLGEVWLLERVGLYGSAFVAAGCNVAAALGALAVGGRAEGATAAADPAPDDSATGGSGRLLAAAALAGLLLLALEVVWFRFLQLFVHAGAAAFAWMLAVVLAGIGGGGLVGGAWLRRRPEAWRRAPLLALSAGALVVLLYAGFHRSAALVTGGSPAAATTVAWLAAAVALPVALLSGVLFPLLGAALARRITPETRATGILTLANTVGSALGSLLAGFVLLPVLGMERSLFLLAAGYAAVAWLARAPDARGGWRSAWAPAAFLAVLLLFPFGRMEQRYLRAPVERFHGGHPHRVLAVREGRSETAVVVERTLGGAPLHRYLLTDSYAMSATTVFARRYMKLYVWWPVALRPEPESALLISYGVGSTARALVATDSLRRIDVVDVSREILGLADVVQGDANPLRDPRVHVHVEDGRYFLAATPERYDLITGEPPPPKAAGVVTLYTKEYFALLRERLNPGGVVTYWLPVHNLLESDAKAIVRAFCDVFGDCALWAGHDLDWMLTGSRGGLAPVSEEAFVRQWRDPEVAEELRATGFERPAQLGATFLGDARWLAERTEGTPPLEDAWPKRLSSRLQPRAHEVFAPWMDEAAARARFRASAFAALWPAELLEPTLAAFDRQAEINAIGRGRGRGWPERLRAVDRLLAEPAFPELASWTLGVTADRLAAADAARGAGLDPAPFAHARATRMLVEGDFAAAARAFARTPQGAPGGPGRVLLEVYARGRAGDLDGAREALRRAGDRLPKTPEFRESVAWLERRFALAEEGS